MHHTRPFGFQSTHATHATKQRLDQKSLAFADMPSIISINDHQQLELLDQISAP